MHPDAPRTAIAPPHAARLATSWQHHTGDVEHTVRTGTLAKIDLSGFTRLTERLALAVQGGAEDLSDAIDATFARLIGSALHRGGDVLQFGGDAIVLWFEGAEHEVRAAATCWDLQQVIRTYGRIDTPLGAVRLRMSAGAASGEVGFSLIGRTHRELITFGPTASEALHLEYRAGAGQVLVSSATARALEGRTVTDVGDGFRLRRSVDAPPYQPPHWQHGDGMLFVPPEVRPLLDTRQMNGEHRRVAVAFFMLAGIDDTYQTGGAAAVQARAARVAEAIDTAVDELGVCWTATDLAEDGIVFLLFAGAVTTTDTDDERLLRAVGDVLDTVDDPLLRAGVNRGRIFSATIGHADRHTRAFLGDTLNLAARLMARAPAGAALVSAATLDRGGARFESTNVEPFMVKGKRAAVQAAILGERRHASATHAVQGPLIGRTHERQRLSAAWHGAVEGHGSALLVVGEPGIGKSMLVADLRNRCEARRVGIVRCDPYESNSPYWAVRPALREATGVTDLASLTAWVRRHHPDPHTVDAAVALAAPCFGLEAPDQALAALDPAAVQDRRHDTVVALLSADVGEPLLLIAEDAHWADEASRSLLLRLADVAPRRPWLLVVTTRPDTAELERSNVETIHLRSLEGDELDELTRTLTASSDLLDRDIADLVERSGGHPLFLSQLIQFAGGDDLPDTIESLLTSRIDTLSAADRSLLRDLSVLGRHISVDAAAAVLDRPGLLESAGTPALDPFLECDPGAISFRHELIRTCAYDGLSKRRRRQLHGRAADTLAARPGEADDGTLAQHLMRAERWGDAWPTAERAAGSARRQGALAVAAELYAEAARAARATRSNESSEANEAIRRDITRLEAAHADTLETLGRFGEAETVLRRLGQLGVASPAERARLARQTARVQRRTGRHASALAWITRGLHAADDMPIGRERDLITCDLLLLRSSVRRLQGRPADARPWALAGLELAERLEAPRLRGSAHLHLEAIAQELALPDRAAHEEQAIHWLTVGEADDMLGMILMNSAFARIETGEWGEALDRLDRAATSFGRIGLGVDELLGRATMGMLLLQQGHFAAARSSLANSHRISRAIGWRQGRAYSLYGTAYLDALEGRMDDALAGFDEAEAIFAHDDVEPFVHEVRRWRAEALLRNGQPAAALTLLDALIDNVGRPADPPLDLAALRLRTHALVLTGRAGDAGAAIDRAIDAATAAQYPYEIAMSRWTRQCLQAGTMVDPSPDVQAALTMIGVTAAVTLAPLGDAMVA